MERQISRTVTETVLTLFVTNHTGDDLGYEYGGHSYVLRADSTEEMPADQGQHVLGRFPGDPPRVTVCDYATEPPVSAEVAARRARKAGAPPASESRAPSDPEKVATPEDSKSEEQKAAEIAAAEAKALAREEAEAAAKAEAEKASQE